MGAFYGPIGLEGIGGRGLYYIGLRMMDGRETSYRGEGIVF